MPLWIPRGLLAFSLLLLASACGSGGQARPYVVGSWPTAADAVQGPIPYVRIDYNEPVTLLNPSDYIVSVDGAGFGTFLARFPDSPNSLFVYPAGRQAFPADATINVTLIQGIVINGLQHYASDIFTVIAESGSEATLPVGEAGAVSLVNCLTGATAHRVSTPGGRTPVGVLSTTIGSTRRIWVQLASGGGTGASLAWFEPGDFSMTPVALTSTGDLIGSFDTLALGPRGQTLYAAFHDDTTLETVLYTVDTRSALETGVLPLASVTPSAASHPTGVALAAGVSPSTIHVTANDGATGVLALVDRTTFTELDQDPDAPDVQGVPLPAGGGPTVVVDTRTIIATSPSADVTLVQGSGTTAELAGIAGVTTDLVRSPDSALTVQGLNGFATRLALQSRTRGAAFDDPDLVEVSDNVAGRPWNATDVRGIAWLASSDHFVVVLGTPRGAVLTEWVYFGGGANFEQVDLNPNFVGTQALPLVANPIVVGTNHGPFAD